MYKILINIIRFLVFSLFAFSCSQNENQSPDSKKYQITHLIKQGKTTQLIVENKPFIILGGEVGNSSFTSAEYMKPIWPKLKAMNLNTILAPVYWELIEPEEGKFDFNLLDQLIDEAKAQNLKIVFLWFASWKNSMSSHVPSWVKLNEERFPRVKDDNGNSHEILTPFSENNLQADLNAFTKLMVHIKELNKENSTIILIQVENEIGMLPAARDYHPLANKKFHENVPSEFIDYLKNNKSLLVPEFKKTWEDNGFKTTGAWEDIFGKGFQTDEIFMAWYFAKYTNSIIEAGKEVYPLPMFVNAALNRPGAEPGKGYPSAGPLPHLMDVWKAAGKSIDFLSPDIYFPDFQHWADLYTRQHNPLFIPEHRFDNTSAAKAVFAIGHYEGMGFSPFSIESSEEPENEDLGKMYDLINQLIPIISANQGQNKINGVLLDKKKPGTVQNFGDYQFNIKHSYTLGYEANAKNEFWEPAGAIIIQTNPKEFYIAGSGIVITFKNTNDTTLNVGILKDEEGRFENNEWKITRYLNGDQTHQGRHIRIFHGDFSIQKLKLYDYK
jgi:hypothetical protein